HLAHDAPRGHSDVHGCHTPVASRGDERGNVFYPRITEGGGVRRNDCDDRWCMLAILASDAVREGEGDDHAMVRRDLGQALTKDVGVLHAIGADRRHDQGGEGLAWYENLKGVAR